MSADDSIQTTDLHRTIALARERKRARLTEIGPWKYLQFVGKVRTIPEGTVIFDEHMIWGYPKIGRILQLDTGIRTQFQQPFWIEEKIDGYNVRIFRHQDAILALTRRGYICPFTTDRLDDLIDRRLFAEHPELVLCAEVAGPGNPYCEAHPPFVPEDVQLFAFDIMRLDQPGFLPYRDKIQLLDAYRLPGVPRFGRYQASDLEKIRGLLLKLDREGREGIVFKEDSPEDRRVKYVTGSTNISDIWANEGSVQQLPPEYFMHRILRLTLFMEEHGLEPTADIHRELGRSLIETITKAVEQYRRHHKVFHTFRCRFRQRANAELMMQAMHHLLGENQVRQHSLTQEGDYYRLEFEKILPRTTGLLNHLLSGGIAYD